MNIGLNGWRRLWILLSVLYLVPVVLVAMQEAPKATDYWDSRLDASIEAVGKYMEQITPGYTFEGSYTVRRKHYSDLTDTEILERLHTKFAGKVDLSRIDREYEQKMDGLRWKQATAIGYAAAWWLGPIVFLYALGSCIAWIIRGFRRTDA